MATDKFPQQNVNMPMSQARVDAARARLTPPRAGAPKPAPSNGNGSRREVRPGEWFDDRRIEIGGPSSKSKDSPPDGKAEGRAVPASYDPLKVYQVTLGKPVVFAGRMLAPGKMYQMVGAACAEITACIIDAVEIGDVPVDPDATPSVAKKSKA
jgi:hypothetical protein